MAVLLLELKEDRRGPLDRLEALLREIRRGASKRERLLMFKSLFTSWVDFELLRLMPLTENTLIYRVGDYLVLCHVSLSKRKRTKWLLIGINDDGKLFANWVSDSLKWQWEREVPKSEEELRRELGFDYNYNGEPLPPVEKPVRIRVQGDLVMSFRAVSADEVRAFFTDMIISALAERIIEAEERRLMEELVRGLTRELRLSVGGELRRDGRGWNDIWAFEVPVPYLNWGKRKPLREALKRVVKEMWSRIPGANDIVVLREVDVSHQHESGASLGSLVVSVALRAGPLEVVAEKFGLQELARRCVEEIRPVPTEVRVGNHIIRTLAYPRRISLAFENPITGNREWVDVALVHEWMSLLTLYAVDDIVIEHDEHGTRVVRVMKCEDKVYEVGFTTTDTGEHDGAIRNRIILERLAGLRR
ncbi:hypothetical protein DRO60_05905 [Candidatus Bathyarchaeota archaeon]|nr:MAG: hypothetical protein DRO60_05905 [Candidatus Bathyarchaeota archaeon]